MKWPFGTQADTMEAGRPGPLDLAKLNSIVEFTSIVFLHPRNTAAIMAGGLFSPSSLFFPNKTPLMVEQTDINGAKLQQQKSDGEQTHHQQTLF